MLNMLKMLFASRHHPASHLGAVHPVNQTRWCHLLLVHPLHTTDHVTKMDTTDITSKMATRV